MATLFGPSSNAATLSVLVVPIGSCGEQTSEHCTMIVRAYKLILTGLEVVGVIVLVERLEGGREAIEAAGLPMHAIFTRQDFIPDEATPS